MKVVYVAGPYTGKTFRDKVDNIMRARAKAIELWKQGYAVICPHSNSANFEYEIPDRDIFIRGDLEIVKRCDVIYMLKGWQSSEGARGELDLARKLGQEIIFEGDD